MQNDDNINNENHDHSEGEDEQLNQEIEHLTETILQYKRRKHNQLAQSVFNPETEYSNDRKHCNSSDLQQ